MSETQEQPAAPKTIEEIQREYAQAATRFGDVSYRLQIQTEDMRAELEALKERMKQLNQRAFNLQQQQQAQQEPKATEEVKEAAAQ